MGGLGDETGRETWAIGLGKGLGKWGEGTSGFLVCGHVVADVNDVIGNYSEADPSLHAEKPFVP